MGFLLGMRHALEADHLAAVAALATRSPTVAHAVRQGAVWGLGHTLTLVLFGAVVLGMDTVMPERLARGLELVVGLMLIALGLDVLRRVWRERIHFHVHHHRDGTVHLHAHSHRRGNGHDTRHHRHAHGFPYRALAVGLMHGMAGSAALILLTLGSITSRWQGISYIALFGLGSMLGMAVLSVAIAMPLRYSAQWLSRLHNALQGTIGFVTIALGVVVTYGTGIAF